MTATIRNLTTLQITIYLWQALDYDETQVLVLLGLTDEEYSLALAGCWPFWVPLAEGRVYLLAP
jgi:hypothetical protein